jgi:peptidyl-prolyl cis-trans isomerase D
MALSFMRRHRRWLYIFLWLVILAFIILYVPALQQAEEGTPGEVLATVGELPITVGEFQRGFYRQRQIYDRLYQGRLDAAAMKQLRLEEQVFDALVVDRLVELESARLGLSVSDEAVARAIETHPQFQDEGRFIGGGEIRRRLELQGMGEEEFERSMRQTLLREELERLVTAAALVSAKEAEREFRRRTEQVRLEYVLVDAARFRESVVPTEDEIRQRFEQKPEEYRIGERRVVSYVLLDRELLRPMVSVSDRDLELYYQDHREDFLQEEEACASHILVRVETPEGGEGHPEDEARRLAEGLLGRLESGTDFAALARASSEDPGSASNGGDLGCFPAGRMVPAFDDAVFALEPGETSGLVRTPFGFHVIRLASRREERVLPFAEVKERVRQLATEDKLRELAETKAQALSEALSRGRSLEEAAKAEGLTVRKSPPFARGETPPALASPSLVARVFEMKAGEVEKEGFALPQGAAFIALNDVQPSRLPSLEEARERVRTGIVEEVSLARAHDLAREVRMRAERSSLERVASASSLVRKETVAFTGRGQPLGDLGTGAALEEAAFTLPETRLSDPVRTSSGWAILRVLERKAFDPAEFEKQKAQLVVSLREQKQSELFRAYLVNARERYAVLRRPEAYRRAIGEGR